MPARRQICLWEGSRQDGPPSSTPPRPLLTFQGPMQTVRVLQKQTLVASDQDCPVKHWAVCTMLLFMQKSAESHLQCPSGHASANIVSWLAFGREASAERVLAAQPGATRGRHGRPAGLRPLLVHCPAAAGQILPSRKKFKIPPFIPFHFSVLCYTLSQCLAMH